MHTMKLTTIITTTAALSLTIMLALAISAQDKPEGEKASEPASSKPLKKIVGDPHKKSAQHERLKELLGIWDVKMLVKPRVDAEAIELTSIATRTSQYDGKLVREEVLWDIPGMGGVNHFTFLYGFNSGTGDFEKMEIGQDTTQINLLTGPWDGKANRIEIRGHHGRVQYGTMEFDSRTVIVLEDNETRDAEGNVVGTVRRERHQTFSTMGDQPEYLQWEFIYTKRKLPTPDMAKMAVHMTPGEGHKRLEAMIGEFTTEMTITMSSSPEASVMKGKATRAWKVPGLILEETTVWGEAPHAFTMHVLIGHHNGTGEYEMTYMHPMNSSMERLTGKADESGTITLSGMVWDSYMGERVLQKSIVRPEVDGVTRGTMTLTYGDITFSTATMKFTRVKSDEDKNE